MSGEMKFPPPPRTVSVRNPDGVATVVWAYSDKGKVQKVRWDPESGEWVCDETASHWMRSASTREGWSLVTGLARVPRTPKRKADDIQVLQARVDNLTVVVKLLCSELGMAPPII